MQSNTTITVEKRVEIDKYDAPAIVYDLTCEHDEMVAVRLHETIPTGFEPTDFGFHRDHGADEWWVGDEEIVFECPIDPDETVTTIVGVRTSDPLDLDLFGSRPTIEAAVDEGGEQCWEELTDEFVDVSVDEDGQTTARPAATDGGEAPLSDESPSGGSDGIRSPDGVDAADSIESAIPEVEDSDGEDGAAETDGPDEIDGDAVVDRFVEELTSDSLSDDQRRRLRAALGVDSVGSMDARIEHCQQRLSDLDAYVDALETFLDEEGSGQELIEDFRDDVAAVESQLSALESDLDETATGQQDLRARVDEMEEEVDSLRSLREDVVSVESQLDEATTEIESLSTTVERLQEWQRGVTAAFGDLPSADP